MNQCLALPSHRNHTTQKIRIAGIACSMSIALQYGASLEKLGDLLADAKYVTSIDHPSLLTPASAFKEEEPHEGSVHQLKHSSADR